MKLYQHQQDGRRLLVKNARFALWWDCGTGKTLTTLAAILELLQTGQIRRVLIICPKVLIDNAWKTDAARFVPELRVASWHDRPRRRFETAQVQLINFESFLRHAKYWQESPPDMLVIDESSRLKDPQAKTSQAIRKLSLRVARCICLSGTPAPNDALEYWGQMFCINPDVLGPNYFKFRLRFGLGEDVYVPGGERVRRFRANPAKVPDLLSRIAAVSHTLRKSDALDLPEQIDQVVEFELGEAQRAAYDELEREAILTLQEQEITADTVLSEIQKLRQICNGWIYNAEHEAVAVGHDKWHVLRDLLEQINRQTVIWVEFREDASRLGAALADSAAMLVGGMSDTDQNNSIQRFKSGQVKYLIANPQTAAYGLTLVNSQYASYYGLGWSWEYHKQSRDRIHRIGQTQRTTYYYLLAKDTVERDIYEAVANKRTAYDAAMEWLRKVQK